MTFIDCIKEEKRLRQLQYDAEWEDKTKEAEKYRQQANYYKNLIAKGELYEPQF